MGVNILGEADEELIASNIIMSTTSASAMGDNILGEADEE